MRWLAWEQKILVFNSQEKLKTMFMQIFLGDKQTASWYVMVFFVVAN